MPEKLIINFSASGTLVNLSRSSFPKDVAGGGLKDLPIRLIRQAVCEISNVATVQTIRKRVWLTSAWFPGEAYRGETRS